MGSDLYHKGDVIFREGDAFQGIFSVKSGLLKAYRHGHYGTDRIKDFYFPKDILGLDGIHSKKYQETLVAANTVSLCFFEHSKLKKILHNHYHLQQKILEIVSEKISDLYDHPDVKIDVEQRLCLFLLKVMIKTEISLKNDVDINLPMLREEIANYIGTAPETISRCLNTLNRKEIIKTTRDGVKVLSINKLEMLDHGRASV